MPRPQMITDSELRSELANGASQAEIARRHGVTEGAISHRVKELNQQSREAVRFHVFPEKEVAALWDARDAVRDNYRRVVKMLDSDCLSTLDKIRISREIRLNLDFAIRALGPLCEKQEVSDFIEEVLSSIEEESPGKREAIVARLSANRDRYMAASSESPLLQV